MTKLKDMHPADREGLLLLIPFAAMILFSGLSLLIATGHRDVAVGLCAGLVAGSVVLEIGAALFGAVWAARRLRRS